MQNNMDFRVMAKMNGISLRQIAAEMKISEPTLYRMLRRQLPEQERRRLFESLSRITTERRTDAEGIA